MADDEGDLWLFGYGQITDLEAATTLRYIFALSLPHDGVLPIDTRPLQISVSRDILKATSVASGSEDHRGTPSQPGRVVTLIERELWETLTDQHPSAPPLVHGAAYRIPAPHVAEVKSYLDIREINGYSMHYTPFHPFNTDPFNMTNNGSVDPTTNGSTSPINCLVYIGTPENPQFLGPQDPQALAERIAGCRGPSGENREYLFMLEEALATLHPGGEGVVDEHVADLAARVREVIAREAGGAGGKLEGGMNGVLK